MIIDNCALLTPMDAEEITAANEAILKIREERYKQEVRQRAEKMISLAVSDAISDIGLAETKTILRRLNKRLREETEV